MKYQGNISYKNVHNKDRNGMDLIEAEDIKKRWQEYTEELYKEDLHDPDNHNGVITDLEPDMDCIVPGILQARILEWVAFPFPRGSSQPRDRMQVSCTAGGFFSS